MPERRPNPYPNTPESVAATSMLGGRPSENVPAHVSQQFAGVYSAYGSNNLDKIAKNPGAASPVPWPSAGKSKSGPAWDKDAVAHALRTGQATEMVDPRQLHASQPGITRGGVDYYLNNKSYHQTGATYADQDNPGNRHPVVSTSRSTGRNLLLSGHHRAGAALLAGRPFEAIRVEGP